ncbi:hypothetical protein MLD38_001040 [Melastoma candidum]|uniref:Uncharacterized protein n=1 Tax=Melastoma candidum TaxID=119954 RepID=A0ACB9SBW4_9MYRT|nr:hypothetical protein MLD38_001040 [Melastoma candidum]
MPPDQYLRNRCASTVELKLKPNCGLLSWLPVLSALLLLLFLLFFYLYCLRSRGGERPLQLGPPPLPIPTADAEVGLKKELREMLPVLIYSKSFSVNDTQCSVCLGDYNAEDRLQQIPACGHAFHMECIDLWLCSHTTCPLCRVSLLAIPIYEDAATDVSI